MARNRLLLLLFVGLAVSVLTAQERSVDALIRDLRSPDIRTRMIALQSLQAQGPAAEPAIPALLDVLRRAGWNNTESFMVYDVLCGLGPPAHRAFPLLVHFMVESESGDEQVQRCIEEIAKGMGSDLVPVALSATANEARLWWNDPRVSGEPTMMADVMAVARAGFVRAQIALGPAALPSLRVALRDRDPFVQAEAAAWLSTLSPTPKSSLPWLREARRASRSKWAHYEIDYAIARAEGQVPR